MGKFDREITVADLTYFAENNRTEANRLIPGFIESQNKRLEGGVGGIERTLVVNGIRTAVGIMMEINPNRVIEEEWVRHVPAEISRR